MLKQTAIIHGRLKNNYEKKEGVKNFV